MTIKYHLINNTFSTDWIHSIIQKFPYLCPPSYNSCTKDTNIAPQIISSVYMRAPYSLLSWDMNFLNYVHSNGKHWKNNNPEVLHILQGIHWKLNHQLILVGTSLYLDSSSLFPPHPFCQNCWLPFQFTKNVSNRNPIQTFLIILEVLQSD